MAKFYGIGVGPGDKELLTIKAVKVIENSDVIVAPKAMAEGKSIALETAEEYIKEGTEILLKHFPMGTPDKEEKVIEAFDSIAQRLRDGKNVAFLTIGDPMVYSTYIHLLNYIESQGFEVETIPGITSFCASASLAKVPLVIGDEPLLIIPATSIARIRDEKNVVIMKVYKREEEVINFLEDKGFSYVYVKKAGRAGQEILRNKEEIIKNQEYMALIIAHRA